MEITCFFDFLCPWAYQSSLWLRDVCRAINQERDELCMIRWRFFSLEQEHKRYGPDWNIWQDSVESPQSKGLLPFLAGAAASLQAETGLDRFYAAAGKLWHEQNQPIWSLSTILKAAQLADLDSENIEASICDQQRAGALLQHVERDHRDAHERFHARGTPTVVFPNGRAVYLAMLPCPFSEKALLLFDALNTIVTEYPAVFEMKHPRTPVEEEQVQQRIGHVRRAFFS